MGEKWLDGYAGHTTEELLALAGEYRIDALVLAFEEAIQEKAAAGPIGTEERYVLAVEALEREVNNGGYDQFFANTGSEFLGVIEDALLAIGCVKTAMITREAIAALGVDTTATDAEVAARVCAVDLARQDALGRCDKSYDASGEAIAERLFEWIGQHRSAVRVGAA